MKENVMDLFMKNISDIRFETVEELFNKKKYIRENYQKLDRNCQEIYKWYFFAQLCVVRRLQLKRAFWYYINSDGEDFGTNKYVFDEYHKFIQEKRRICKKNAEEATFLDI